MSLGEVCWRCSAAARNAADYARHALGRLERGPVALVAEDGEAVGPPDHAAPVGAWRTLPASDLRRAWRQRLVARAERLLANRLDLFDLEGARLGDPPAWNRDLAHGVDAPMGFARWIDYRDFDRCGDCKLVWEPNRHHHFVVLARAYRATGRVEFAECIARQLASWLEACPFGVGMNWRSPLELGVRLINWTWTWRLAGSAPAFDSALRRAWLRSVACHLWEIRRNHSRASSANNHLIGEAAGVWIAAHGFGGLQGVEGLRTWSRDALESQILAQTHADGGPREQAVGYHLFVLQFFLLAALCAHEAGAPLSDAYQARLKQMFEFLATLGGGGARLVEFGDADDGYVLDLDADPHDYRPWLTAAAVWFERPDWLRRVEPACEAATWLLGSEAAERCADYSAVDVLAGDVQPLRSRAFAQTGLYLLQSGREADERLSVSFDCGELGYGALAAHGHADALSVTVRVGGRDVLVDPGTYDYFTYPAWRDYFRSTRAHNTLVVDGLDQSEMLGPFLWGRRASARCLAWAPLPAGGGSVSGEHDGYGRLADPVLHRRDVRLEQRTIEIRDRVLCERPHELTLCFHLAEDCQVHRTAGRSFEIVTGPVSVTLLLDSRLSPRLLRGSRAPLGGWVSRGYHRKQPAWSLLATGRLGPATLVTRLRVERFRYPDAARRAAASDETVKACNL